MVLIVLGRLGGRLDDFMIVVTTMNEHRTAEEDDSQGALQILWERLRS